LPATELVIFDLDGTLVDFPSTFRAASEEAFSLAEEHFGPLPVDRLYARLLHHDRTIWPDYAAGRISIREVWRRRFLLPLSEADHDPPAQLISRMISHFEEALGRLSRLYPDALPCLEALKDRYRLAYLTNAPAGTVGPKLQRTGIGPFFSFGGAAEAFGALKPAGKVFEALLAGAGVEAPRAVMVGDDWEEDVAGARAAGLEAVWLRRPGDDFKGRAARALERYDEARSYRPVVETLRELPDLLGRS